MKVSFKHLAWSLLCGNKYLMPSNMSRQLPRWILIDCCRCKKMECSWLKCLWYRFVRNKCRFHEKWRSRIYCASATLNLSKIAETSLEQVLKTILFWVHILLKLLYFVSIDVLFLKKKYGQLFHLTWRRVVKRSLRNDVY